MTWRGDARHVRRTALANATSYTQTGLILKKFNKCEEMLERKIIAIYTRPARAPSPHSPEGARHQINNIINTVIIFFFFLSRSRRHREMKFRPSDRVRRPVTGNRVHRWPTTDATGQRMGVVDVQRSEEFE